MTTQAKPRPLSHLGEVRSYPVLPLRDIVVFPHTIVPLFAGREKSNRALEEAMRSDGYILLATQKKASDDNPPTDSIHEVGTLASVLQLLKSSDGAVEESPDGTVAELEDGTVKVLLEGAVRARVLKYGDGSDYYEAEAVVLADEMGEKVEAEAMARSVVNEFENYVKLRAKQGPFVLHTFSPGAEETVQLHKEISPEVAGLVRQMEDFAKLADNVASHLDTMSTPRKQAILETVSVAERLESILNWIESEISVLRVETNIRTRVQRQMEETERRYYLKEQMKAIQKEPGDEEDGA